MADVNRMYPSMSQQAPAQPSAPAPSSTPAPAELPPNQGMQLQAGIKNSQPAQDSVASTPPLSPAHATAPAADAEVEQVQVTREALAALYPPETLATHEAEAAARSRYSAALVEALPPAATEQEVMVRDELVHAAHDFGISGAEVADLVKLGRDFKDAKPSAAQVANWKTFTSTTQQQAAAQALSRNPILRAVLAHTGIIDSPQVVRLLSRK